MTIIKKSIKPIMMMFILGVFMATSLFYNTPTGEANTVQTSDIKTRLTVTATGNVNVAPDQARVSLAVVTFNKDLTKAQNENTTLTEKVFSALTAKGLSRDCIQTLNYTVWPEYNYSIKENTAPEIIGYRVRNEISVIVEKVDTLGSILDTAVSAGANNVNHINFDKSNMDEDENQALTVAIERAKSKAETIAKAVGMNLGLIVSINEGGVYNIPPSPPILYAKDESIERSSLVVPVNPGEIKVSASVTLIYELK